MVIEAPKDPRLIEFYARYQAGQRNFGRAQLARAIFGHPTILKEVDLSGANLCDAELPGARLIAARLDRAYFVAGRMRELKLHQSSAIGTVFTAADLRYAELRDVNARGAECGSVDFTSASVLGCSFSEANLFDARFIQTVLCDAASHSTFDGARLGNTVFAGVSLRPFCRAARLLHVAPSSVDFASILESFDEPNLHRFLRDVGLPEGVVGSAIDAAQAVRADPASNPMQSTFISYGEPDAAFAEYLNAALQRHGVRTFLFKDHAQFGEKLHRMMHKGVNEHDRVVLVCSAASLSRSGVLNEIEETFDREARDGGKNYLIPIRLDDFVLNDNSWAADRPDIRQKIRARYIADFRDVLDSERRPTDRLSQQVLKLVDALRVNDTRG